MSESSLGPKTYAVDRDLVISANRRLLVGGAPLRAVLLRQPLPTSTNGQIHAEQLSPALANTLTQRGMLHPVVRENEELMAEQLTVIIPTFGRGAQVEALVRSLSGVRIIVVDDASPDPRDLAMLGEMRGVRVIRHERNRGPGAARNTGIAAAITPYVAFVDSDIVTDAITLQRLGSHLIDPRVALVSPRILAPELPAEHGVFSRWLQRMADGLCALDMGTSPAVVQPHSRVGWLPSACLLGRREDLAMFADHTVAEDVDLIWRTIDAGHGVRYDPSFTVRHPSRETLVEALRRKSFYGSGAAWLQQRHPGRAAPAVVSRTTLLLHVGLLTIHRRWGQALTAASLVYIYRRTRVVLPDAAGRSEVAAQLTLRTVRGSIEQLSDLALRHWWPATWCTAALSTSVRKWLAVSLATHVIRHRRQAMVRLVEGMAYGYGVWREALRRKDFRSLLPALN